MTNPEWADLDIEDIKDDYKDALSELDKALELQKLAVERAVNQRVLTEEEGQLKIQELEIQSAEKRVKVAQEAYDKFEASSHVGELFEANQKIEQMTEAHYKLLSAMMKKHNTEINKQNDKLVEEDAKQKQKITDHQAKLDQFVSDKDDKRAEYKQEMSDKVEDIERDLAQKIGDINQKLNDKLKDLTDKRVEAEKKAQADILGIRQSFEEKLLKLEQRGLSEEEVDLSNESFAREQYSKAQAALAQAIRGSDIDGIEQAVELFEKAGDYFGDLADTSKARSGITSVRDALVNARKEEEKIAKAKIAREQKDAIASAQVEKDKAKREAADQLTDFTQAQDKKLAKALDTVQQQEQAEDRRWQKELANYEAAIAKIAEKKQAAIAAQQEIDAYMNQSALSQTVDQAAQGIGLNAAGNISPTISQEGKQDLTKIHEQAAADGIAKGIQHKDIANAMGQVDSTGLGEKIAEDVGAGVQKGLSQVEQYTMIGDQTLDEWRKSGEKQGEAAGEAAGEKLQQEISQAILEYNSQGEVVTVTVKESDADLEAVVKASQEEFDNNPMIISLNDRDFDRQLDQIIRNAQNSKRVVIPVYLKQANAEGGPVYKMASGGRLPGQSGPNDTLDVKARPGEWFIRNEAVAEWQRRIGNWFMPGVNRPNSTPGKYLQSLLVHGTQANAVPSIPDIGKMTIELNGRQAEIMGTPINLKNFVNMMKDAEAFSS